MMPVREARLVHAEEAHEFDVVAPRGRPKAHADADEIVDGVDRTLGRMRLPKGNERVVYVDSTS